MEVGFQWTVNKRNVSEQQMKGVFSERKMKGLPVNSKWKEFSVNDKWKDCQWTVNGRIVSER